MRPMSYEGHHEKDFDTLLFCGKEKVQVYYNIYVSKMC